MRDAGVSDGDTVPQAEEPAELPLDEPPSRSSLRSFHEKSIETL